MSATSEETQFELHAQKNLANTAIVEALNTFGQAVSMGIAVLVQRLGYSSTRAAHSILNVVAGCDYKLDDDKVGSATRTVSLGC